MNKNFTRHFGNWVPTEWTTVETIICAVTGGFDCIAIEAAACIEKNCF